MKQGQNGATMNISTVVKLCEVFKQDYGNRLTLRRPLGGNMESPVRKSLQQAEIMKTLPKGSNNRDRKRHFMFLVLYTSSLINTARNLFPHIYIYTSRQIQTLVFFNLFFKFICINHMASFNSN